MQIYLHRLKRFLLSLNLGYAVPLSLEEKLWRLRTNAAWMTIDLPLEKSDNGQADKVEEFLVEKLGENQYRIASSPGMLQGLAADDVIALDPGLPMGYRLLQRGDNVCIHIFCQPTQRDAVLADLSRILRRIGGVLDGTMGETGLCFTVPVLAGFAVIEDSLRKVVGEEWFYANVYDLETNEPLNWWLAPEKRAKNRT